MKKIKKKIGVTCTTVFHYIHFKYIVNELRGREFDVDYIIYTPRHTSSNRFERLEKFFTDNGESFQTFEDVFSNNVRYDALFAPYFMPGFELLDSSIIKIRLLYGYAKDSWNYAIWNKGFDLILSYGPYATERLIKYTEVVEIGHPRIRLHYKDRIDDVNGKKFIKDQCKRPVLVYCPTWADLSSLQVFTTQLSNLTRNFEVIVKLHHGNVLTDNQEYLKVIRENQNLYLFDDFTDLFDLLNVADIILSDYSGAIFDAMIFKKRIVLIDVIPEHFKETGQVNLSNMLNVNSKLSNEGNNTSLDIAIRKFLPHVKSDEDLSEILCNVLIKDTLSYEHLLNKLYSSTDTAGSVRGAIAIQNHLQDNEFSQISIDNSIQVLNIDKVKAFLKKNKGDTVTIWGAGEMGQILYIYLKYHGYNINILFDEDVKKSGNDFYDTKILSKSNHLKVLVAVANAYYDIKRSLEKKGLLEGKDFISIFRRDDL